MRKFFIRILMSTIPFGFMLVFYLIFDPFKVLWHYDQYYLPSDFIPINRGYASTCIYDNNCKHYHYDSFILGNSRSTAYMVSEWKKYIPKSSKCFHLDCSWGSIEDLYYKTKYINEHGDTLKNVLFVIDYDVLSNTSHSGKGHLFETPPQIKGYSNYIPFQLAHLKAFCDIGFLRAIFDYALHHEYRQYMIKYICNNRKVAPITNDWLELYTQDSLIRIGKYYTRERIKLFENVHFPDSVFPIALNEDRKGMLMSISKMLKKNKSNFKIIISPLYSQIKLNPSDLSFLKMTFGANNVYDFSGPNKWNKDYHNYYDRAHYRTSVANEVLKIIYQ